MFNQINLFYPLFAQVGITFVVWLWMYKTRLREIKKLAIRPEEIATDHELTEKLNNVVAPSDNFKNLFEIPVLFYVLILSLYITNNGNEVFVILLSLFVATRAVHSIIHCTYNRVVHRFYAYVVSAIILWVMIIRAFITVL